MRGSTLFLSLLFSLLSLGIGAVALESRLLAEGPDEDVVFVRETPSEQSQETLFKSLNFLSNWPEWHHFLDTARRIDIRGLPMHESLQSLERGALVRMVMIPKQQEWRTFELTIEITDYTPGKGFEARLTEDRRGKISALFNQLRWKLELEPRTDGKPGSLVRCTVVAHTASARARVLSGLVKRILMNQVSYVDLSKLASLTQPRGVVLTPTSQR